MIVVLLLLLENVAGQHLSGPGEVKQCAGRTVYVECRYHSFYRDSVKYWCKGYYFNYCTVLIKTSQSQEAYEHLQIKDDKRYGLFTIQMKNAQTEDSGWYWCAIERVSAHVRKDVQLIISAEEAQHCSVTEPPQNVKEATTEALTTSALTTFRTTIKTSTSHTTLKTTDLTQRLHETRPGEIYITQWLSLRKWRITRWILFTGMCLYLISFITCFNIWVRRHSNHRH